MDECSLKIITDPVHGNIVFSKLEGVIFTSVFFNRLHNIIQNSMAYRVFPMAKHSRFSHSIGVMHITGEMFKHSLINSNKQVSSEFLSQNLQVIRDFISQNKNYLNYSSLKRENDLDKFMEENLLEKLTNIIEGTHFTQNISFYSDLFVDKKIYFTYLLISQALRLASLFHDVGHLPFSHQTEFALESLIEDYTEDNTFKNTKQTFFGNIYSSKGKIHEIIGKKVSLYILLQIREGFIEIKPNYELSNLSIEVLFDLIQYFLQKIFENHNSMYDFLDSSLDTDKLDYVVRDSISSGMTEGRGNIGRISRMFCLVKDRDEFYFRHSVQALNDIEQFIENRYRLFKFVFNHHKVKRMDYIFQVVIEMIIKEEIISKDEKNNPIALLSVSDILSVLESLLDKDANINQKYELSISELKFMQISDYWMISLLNNKYLELKSKGSSSILLDLLEDLLKASNTYKSLWKRKNDKYDSFVTSLGCKFREIISKKTLKKKSSFSIDIESILLTRDKKLKNISDYEFGDFLIHFITHKEKKVDLFWLKEIQNQLFLENKNILIVKTYLPTGLKQPFYLVDLKQHSIKYSFYELSKISEFLENDIKNYLKIFVFYNKNNSDIKSDDDVRNIVLEKIIWAIQEKLRKIA